MLRYSRKERRGRLDLRIGSILNFIEVDSVTHVGAHLAEEAWEYEYFKLPVTWVEAIPELVSQVEKFGLPSNQRIIQRLFAEQAGQIQTLNMFGPGYALSSVLEVRHPELINKKIDLVTSVLDELPSTDLLVIDVQGAELDVLRGGELFLARCKYLFIEVSLSDIYYASTPTLTNIEKYLNSIGFDLSLKVLHGHNGLEGNCLFLNREFVSKFERKKLESYQLFRSSLLQARFLRSKLHRKFSTALTSIGFR
jgi:FkbM family methyltransferase